ncbi:MAG: protein kinase [Patescibacteria group bacterium]|jgi:serine/threonine protein kinase
MRNFETKTTEPNQESNESEKKFEDYLKTEILLKSKKINEGNKGIIGMVNLDHIPAKINFNLNRINTNIKVKEPLELATKILKIYQFGAGKQEFEMQQRAYNLINQTNPEEFIKIPQIYFYRQLSINNNDTVLRNKLESDGIDLSSKKCDVLLMDFIPGDDFGSYLYKEIIKRATDRDLLNDRELIEFREEIKTGKTQPDFTRLNEVVSFLVGLTYDDQQDNAINTDKIDRDNHLKIIKFLQNKDFQLPVEKFNKIKKTLNYLNKNGIYHRDLHERNIMLTYDSAGGIADFYLVDFGSTVDNSADSSEESEYDKNYVVRDDNFILRIYETLTKNPIDLKKEKNLKLLNNLEKISQRLKNLPAVKNVWTTTLGSKNLEILSLNIEKIIKKITSDPDAAWEIRYALIVDLSKNNVALARDYIKHNLPKVPLAIKNNLNQINHLL